MLVTVRITPLHKPVAPFAQQLAKTGYYGKVLLRAHLYRSRGDVLH